MLQRHKIATSSHTRRALSVAAFLICSTFAAAQAVRVDPLPVFTTSGTSNPAGGIYYPAVLAVPGANITVCNYPANGVPCTNLATTYTGAAGGTCPTSSQITLQNSSICQATTDGLGNFGFWVTPGLYSYIVNTPQGTFGPYAISAGGGSNGNVSTTAPATFGAYLYDFSASTLRIPYSTVTAGQPTNSIQWLPAIGSMIGNTGSGAYNIFAYTPNNAGQPVSGNCAKFGPFWGSLVDSGSPCGAGSGGVSGPGSSVIGRIPTWSNTMGSAIGAGLIPTGNGPNAATSTGTLTPGNCTKTDSNGNIVDAGAPCGTAITVQNNGVNVASSTLNLKNGTTGANGLTVAVGNPSGGDETFNVVGNLTISGLQAIGADAFIINPTGSSANPTTLTMPNCPNGVAYSSHTLSCAPTLTLTTTGTSGPATLTGSTLNIPQYAGGSSLPTATAQFQLLIAGAGPSYTPVWAGNPTSGGFSCATGICDLTPIVPLLGQNNVLAAGTTWDMSGTASSGSSNVVAYLPTGNGAPSGTPTKAGDIYINGSVVSAGTSPCYLSQQTSTGVYTWQPCGGSGGSSLTFAPPYLVSGGNYYLGTGYQATPPNGLSGWAQLAGTTLAGTFSANANKTIDFSNGNAAGSQSWYQAGAKPGGGGIDCVFNLTSTFDNIGSAGPSNGGCYVIDTTNGTLYSMEVIAPSATGGAWRVKCIQYLYTGAGNPNPNTTYYSGIFTSLSNFHFKIAVSGTSLTFNYFADDATLTQIGTSHTIGTTGNPGILTAGADVKLLSVVY